MTALSASLPGDLNIHSDTAYIVNALGISFGHNKRTMPLHFNSMQ